MPDFKVVQIKNSEHVGALELTLSLSAPCFIILFHYPDRDSSRNGGSLPRGSVD